MKFLLKVFLLLLLGVILCVYLNLGGMIIYIVFLVVYLIKANKA